MIYFKENIIHFCHNQTGNKNTILKPTKKDLQEKDRPRGSDTEPLTETHGDLLKLRDSKDASQRVTGR